MELSTNEFYCLCDCMNGHFWDKNFSAKDEILPNLEDCLVDGLAEKWNIDGKELLSKIKKAEEKEIGKVKKEIIEYFENN